MKDDVRKSFEESEVDGLIKWAIELPDDIASHSQTSFYKKMPIWYLYCL